MRSQGDVLQKIAIEKPVCCYSKGDAADALPQVNFEAVRVVFLVAVGAGGFVGLRVSTELPLHNGVGCQHHISIF